LIPPKGQARTGSEHAPCAYTPSIDLLICELRFLEPKLSGLSLGVNSVGDVAQKDRPQNVPGSTRADDAASSTCCEPRDTSSSDRVRVTSSSEDIVPLALCDDHALGPELGATKTEERLPYVC
jgi:hypothetical protein